ncbi:Hypothetical protein R9X50_00660700 [Acrodontium crateriforme]|uniref:T6SS Phospholipase effector Tle1-like catalytic domain-containing protein n=1 Tax=Acrodontium crateriforme TaxID=150365 RepID=A0AAQ3M8M8_9PEZI|nr:Hypothetical protein R9X50_00660700 [Acrodontium crateriforme]
MPLIDDQAHEPNKLILCFDGTGNTFSGSNADTNVVKILNKLDRHHPKQFHYYQTGVGTYDINEKSVNKTWLGETRSSISQTIDQAIGTTFDSHVMAGYRFLMRYYSPGDKIYMFGFSRGAFTAKFLARMVHTVGLLCKGNEEMVPFAYRLYQRYLTGEIDDFNNGTAASDVTDVSGERAPLLNANAEEPEHADTYESAKNEIVAFSNTFCRKEFIKSNGKTVEVNVKVYFLGIWDCVNSVAVLEREAPMPVPVTGTADFYRHAVAIDERRVKFKPALIAQDTKSTFQTDEDVKEVWFPGCHGDVGGGWPASKTDNVIDEKKSTWWQRFRKLWTTVRPKGATKDVRKDAFQLSDVALSWMIREMELVGEKDPAAAVKWSDNARGYKAAFARDESQKQALKGIIHDSLTLGSGTSLFKVLLWKFMEYLPIITRWELNNNVWSRVRFPLNKGSYRDIPRDAVLHESVLFRLNNVMAYSPGNNHGGNLKPCLKHNGVVAQFDESLDSRNSENNTGHRTYVFSKTD